MIIRAEAHYPSAWPDQPDYGAVLWRDYETSEVLHTILCDERVIHWAGLLAASEESPDFILVELNIPDYIQHITGYKTDFSHWSLSYVDTLVGKLLHMLRETGADQRYNLAVLGDHGHSPIRYAISPRALLDGVPFATESGTLHVKIDSEETLKRITGALAAYDVQPVSNAYLPAEQRTYIYSFAAPESVIFQDTNADEIICESINISSHGLRPGFAGDQRLCLFYGPQVPRGSMETAQAIQVAPTLAAILGLRFPSDQLVEPMFNVLQQE